MEKTLHMGKWKKTVCKTKEKRKNEIHSNVFKRAKETNYSKQAHLQMASHL
jgi:hypothetical protein